MERFTKSFTQAEPIPEAGIAAAVAVMRSGRLHRYDAGASEVAALEREFAAFTGARHALAVASGGYALGLALRGLGVGPGEPVLTNVWTLAPVPGAIAAVGARPVYVGVTEGLTIDLDDLAAKAGTARVLLLSHMRGHIADMDRLMGVCDAAGVTVIEDCAHTMGASWRGVPSGRHGRVGCYSTQTYKHLNSGEGGLVVTDDGTLAARMVLISGSYMHYSRHGAAPGPEAFAALASEVPNVSGRMDEVRAAMLRPQLAVLPARAQAWTERYRVVEAGLRGAPGLRIVERAAAEEFVGSSIQFLLPDWPDAAIQALVASAGARGVILSWFGAAEPAGYTSTYRHWHFAPAGPMPESDRVLRAILDMRLPLAFTLADCAAVARIVAEEVAAAGAAAPSIREAPTCKKA